MYLRIVELNTLNDGFPNQLYKGQINSFSITKSHTDTRIIYVNINSI